MKHYETISHWGMYYAEPEPKIEPKPKPNLESQFIEGWELALEYPHLTLTERN